MDIEALTHNYSQALRDFIRANRLPHELFAIQDHLAFKAYNTEDYNNLIKQIAEISTDISEVWMDDRRIAAAKLMGEHAIDTMMGFRIPPNMINWVEIMEAKSGEESNQSPRLDHEEILHHSMLIIRSVLRRRRIPFAEQSNHSHTWVSVQISGQGDELKFTDTALKSVVEKEIARGDNVRIVKP